MSAAAPPLLTATEIPWGKAGTVPSPLRLVRVGVRALPAVEDDDHAALVESLLDVIVDLHEELRSIAACRDAALSVAHTAQRDLEHVRGRYHACLDAQRARERS